MFGLIRSRWEMLTWVIIAFLVLLLAVTLIGVWILLRNRSLRFAAREQISILLEIRRVVNRIHFVVISGGLGLRVPQPDLTCETPLSPSGQWPSLQILVRSEVHNEEETSV